eukprot:s101_g19.t2
MITRLLRDWTSRRRSAASAIRSEQSSSQASRAQTPQLDQAPPWRRSGPSGTTGASRSRPQSQGSAKPEQSQEFVLGSFGYKAAESRSQSKLSKGSRNSVFSAGAFLVRVLAMLSRVGVQLLGPNRFARWRNRMRFGKKSRDEDLEVVPVIGKESEQEEPSRGASRCNRLRCPASHFQDLLERGAAVETWQDVRPKSTVLGAHRASGRSSLRFAALSLLCCPTFSGAALMLAGMFFRDSAMGRRAISLSVAVFVLLLLEIGAIVYYSSVQKEYMTALQEKNIDAFYHGLWMVGAVIIFISPIIALHEYTSGMLKMTWRASLTRRFAGLYLAAPGYCEGNPFYRLTLTGEIDNPDQRICQDVHEFVGIAVHLAQDVVPCICWCDAVRSRTVLNITSFAAILYSISPAACYGVLVYSIVGTIVATKGFGPWLGFYQLQRVKQEAGLRYDLIRVRENAESVAFFEGGEAEWSKFNTLFTGLLQTVYKSVLVTSGFGMFNRSFHWATFAVAPLLVGPAYLRGEVQFGVISQASMAFNIILGAMTLIMDKLESLTDVGVRVRRLEDLELSLRKCQNEMQMSRAAGLAGVQCIASAEPGPSDTAMLRFCKVTLRTPPRAGILQQTLCHDLSFELVSNQSLLIVGESGIGKSSLLRAAAGLWTDGRGTLQLCKRQHVFFMPQRPYMFLGSLRDQLLYPHVEESFISNSDLEKALRQVNLGHLLEQHSLSESKEWASLLSLGQQQRINFARVLLRSDVRMALIDEGTSACDPANEAVLYELLQQGLCSYVSIGSVPSDASSPERTASEALRSAMWARRIGAPARCPSQTRVIIQSMMNGAIGLVVYQYMDSLSAGNLDYTLESVGKSNLTCLTGWLRRNELTSWTQYDTWSRWWEYQTGVDDYVVNNTCVPFPVDAYDQSCSDMRVPVHEFENRLGYPLGLGEKVSVNNELLYAFAYTFLVLGILNLIGFAIHDLALLSRSQQNYVLDWPAFNEGFPIFRRFTKLSGITILRALFSIEGTGSKLALLIGIILTPIITAWALLFLVFIVTPALLLLYVRYPVRLSRFAVFLTLIATAVFGLTMAIIPLVYLVNLDERPRYALVFQVQDYQPGTCYCGCSYFINAASLVRIFAIGAGVVFTSCLSAFRCLKGLRRAQWANLMSVLFPIPVTVYSVFWKTPNDEPIRHRKEGEPVQSELAFDPFALMDEQPESRYMTVTLKPEFAYDVDERGRWKPMGDRMIDGPKLPELKKGELFKQPTEVIGCCGFPCLTGGYQVIYVSDDEEDPQEPALQPLGSLASLEGGLSPQVLGVDSMDTSAEDALKNVRSKHTAASKNTSGPMTRRARGESNASIEEKTKTRLPKHVATLRLARGSEEPASRTGSPLPSPAASKAAQPPPAPEKSGSEMKLSL